MENINNNTSVSISELPTRKKISFFSAMMIVVGSSIGAGIFFKAKSVLEYSEGSLILAIFAWIIAAFAVISMALALIEISAARNDNLSLIGWCKVFNSSFIYKSSKNFMTYLYVPLTFFFMPFYFLMSLQDSISCFSNYIIQPSFMLGGNGSSDWIVWMIICLLISLSFIVVSGASSRIGNILNLCITSIKFIPLAMTVILGIIIFSISPSEIHVSAGVTSDDNISSIHSSNNFAYLSPGIGLFMAMGGIFFAYDGFYVTAGLQTEMKEPKKTPIAIFLGLGTVTIIYLVISIIMSLTGNGGISGFENWLRERDSLWVLGIINLTIAIGILGIINGFSMWSPRFIEDLIREKELPFSEKIHSKLNDHKPIIGIIYCIIITVPIFILFSIIGALGYINIYGDTYGHQSLGKLYSFCDLMATWTAVFAFLFVMLPIYGGLRNRKTKKVKIEEKKYFIPTAIISVLLISIVLIILVLDSIVNIIFIATSSFDNDEIIGRIMKLVTLILFVLISGVPSLIEIKLDKNKNNQINVK